MRGRPYTEYIPKAMIPVDGKPIIARIVSHVMSSDEIDHVAIVSDFANLGGQIGNYFGKRSDITFIQDSQSGTAGDLLHASGFLGNDKEFLLWFADNLCAIDVSGMVSLFRSRGSLACIATRTRRREETGFAVVEDLLVREFREKPVVELPMHECLGIYVLSGRILDLIRSKERQGGLNLSYDVLEDLAVEGAVSAFDIGDTEWIDVESPLILDRNPQAVRDIIGSMGR